MRSVAATLVATAAFATAAVEPGVPSITNLINNQDSTIVFPIVEAAGVAPTLASGAVVEITIASETPSNAAAAWVTANKDIMGSADCKISTKTVIYGAPSANFIASTDASEYVAETAAGAGNDKLVFKVTANAAVTGEADKPINIICKIKNPADATAVVADGASYVIAGADPETADLPQVYTAATYPDTQVAAADVTIVALEKGLTTKIVNALTKNVVNAESADVATKQVITKIGLKNVVQTETAADSGIYTVTFQARGQHSLDVSAADAQVFLIAEVKKAIVAAGVAETAVTVAAPGAAVSVAGHCFNKVLDGAAAAAETEIDLGGSDCNNVGKGQACRAATECWTGVCEGYTAAAGETAEKLGDCVNSASALTVSFGVVAAFVATALFGF